MLPAGKSASAPEFQRSVAATAFALVNCGALQKEIARGGGEGLHALAALLGGPDAGRVEAAAVQAAPVLVTAERAPEFVARLDAVLAARPELTAYRF